MATLEQLQAHLSTPPEPLGIAGYFTKPLAMPVRCKDGTTMSVQASTTHYSTPQENIGPYTHVEVWYCGSPETWSEYGNGDEPYAYIPIELVVAEIDRRGGMELNVEETQT